ncbi:MAG: TIGR04222 domain-containing membrane protein [Candidatus Melainabacteria bacterium]|nr:TIGR04222 domain-containing membrane protein [Candidatus Melainabacteria bacterium]
MNEFDLIGPQFLTFYVPLTFGTILGAVATRYALKITNGEYQEVELSAYDAAYLSGGEKRVVDAAAAKLLVSDILTAGTSPPSITAKATLPNDADPVERAVLQSARNHSITNVRDIYKYVLPISQSIRPKLIGAGLILSDARTAAIRVICTLMVLTPIVFWGAPRILLGMSRHKPVGFLVLLCLMGLAAAVYFFCQTCVRTARGDDAVAFLKAENRTLEYSVTHGSGGSSHELAMAAGLFGTSILMASPLFAPMRPVFAAPVSAGSTGGSSGGCGSSCGGGGCGGGCGGCGG